MADRDDVRRSYDELADTYAAERSEDGPAMRILDRFLDGLGDGGRILDAGCGQGRPVLERLDRTATAVGLDFSAEQLRLAADAVPGAALAQGDMTHLPFDDGAFDAAVAYWSIIHVPLADHQAVVDEFARILRPGGRVLLCEGAGEEWVGENPDWLDTGVEMQWEMAGAEATADQLRDAGFSVYDQWGAPERLAEDDESTTDEGSSADDTTDDDLPWAFFAARLDG